MKITSFDTEWGASSLTFTFVDVPAFGKCYVALESTSWESEDPPYNEVIQVTAVYVIEAFVGLDTWPVRNTIRQVHRRLREACVEALNLVGTVTFAPEA